MPFEVIDNHTVVTDHFFDPDAWVLDVGSRGMMFAQEVSRRGPSVVAMDPDPSSWEGIPAHPRIHPVAAALVAIGAPKYLSLARWDNGQANHLITPSTPKPERAEQIAVVGFDIREVMERYSVKQWACVKLNCEGAEYDILRTWPGPIARHMSVSFHDHTGANPRGEETYKEIFAHLGQWYEVFGHKWETRYCAGYSYWDTVFCLRENE